MKIVEVPIELPKGWRATDDSRGVVIESFDEKGVALGMITVSEQARGYALGLQDVRRSHVTKTYEGRGWKQKLYSDAVAALQAVWTRQQALTK